MHISPKGFRLEDLRRVYGLHDLDGELFALMDKLMRDVAAANAGFIDPAMVQQTLVQVSTMRRVDEQIAIIKSQEANDPRTKDDKAADRAKLKIGEQLLNAITATPGRALFGAAIKSVADTFRAVDTDGSGELDKEEFKVFCKRMDLGLSVQQLQELWGSFDTDSSGKVTEDEFQDLLMTVQANKCMHDAKRGAPTPIMYVHCARAHTHEHTCTHAASAPPVRTERVPSCASQDEHFRSTCVHAQPQVARAVACVVSMTDIPLRCSMIHGHGARAGVWPASCRTSWGTKRVRGCWTPCSKPHSNDGWRPPTTATAPSNSGSASNVSGCTPPCTCRACTQRERCMSRALTCIAAHVNTYTSRAVCMPADQGWGRPSMCKGTRRASHVQPRLIPAARCPVLHGVPRTRARNMVRYRSALRGIETKRLSPVKRSNFLSVFEQYVVIMPRSPVLGLASYGGRVPW